MVCDVFMATRQNTIMTMVATKVVPCTAPGSDKKIFANPLMAILWGNMPSNRSMTSDIECKKIGGLDTNLNIMNIIIAQKCV